MSNTSLIHFLYIFCMFHAAMTFIVIIYFFFMIIHL